MTIALEMLILAAIVVAVVGIGIGYWWASSSQKRAAGGKNVKELAAEKEAYEEQVVDHFKTTADLLNEMTDKYRDVYRHMAEGAQKLAPVDSAAPALAALQNGLLTAPSETHAAEAVIDSPTQPPTDGSKDPQDAAAISADEQDATRAETDAEQDGTNKNEHQAPANAEPPKATEVRSEEVEEVSAEAAGDSGDEFFSGKPQADSPLEDEDSPSTVTRH
ncbi:MAG: YhcB family protein [Gammaproteobacteria bacterium]